MPKVAEPGRGRARFQHALRMFLSPRAKRRAAGQPGKEPGLLQLRRGYDASVDEWTMCSYYPAQAPCTLIPCHPSPLRAGFPLAPLHRREGREGEVSYKRSRGVSEPRQTPPPHPTAPLLQGVLPGSPHSPPPRPTHPGRLPLGEEAANSQPPRGP